MSDDHTQYLIEGLDRDRQLKDNPELKEKIKAVLKSRLGGTHRNENPFRSDPVHDPEQKPEWVEKVETTETPIEKIRAKNRYIK